MQLDLRIENWLMELIFLFGTVTLGFLYLYSVTPENITVSANGQLPPHLIPSAWAAFFIVLAVIRVTRRFRNGEKAGSHKQWRLCPFLVQIIILAFSYLMLWLLGFLAATFTLVIALMIFTGARRPAQILAVACGSTLFLSLITSKIFRLPLF